MKSEWDKGMKLTWGDIISLEYGKPVPDKFQTNGDVPVFGTNGQIGTSNLPPLCSHASTIVGRKGAYRGVHYSNVPFSVIDTAFFVEETTKLTDSKWIYYKLLTLDINRMDSGSAIPSTDRSEIYSLPVTVPPLPTQRKIASILSALDDKIEINNAICRNLEEQAEAIFSQYYQKENEPRLFTSVIQISGGGTPKTSEPSFWNGNIPFFTPKDAESPFAFTTEKTLTEEGLNNCSSILYPEWTTFITARGTVGKISLAGRAMAMNQSCYALISEEIHPLLIYFYALVVVKSLKQKASGAVFDAIVTRDFDREEIKLLKKDEQQLLLMRIEPIYTQIRSLKLENLKLAETRSALISKLMSGELTV